SPPSSTAMQLLVVPRSIPSVFAMCGSPPKLGLLRKSKPDRINHSPASPEGLEPPPSTPWTAAAQARQHCRRGRLSQDDPTHDHGAAFPAKRPKAVAGERVAEERGPDRLQ